MKGGSAGWILSKSIQQSHFCKQPQHGTDSDTICLMAIAFWEQQGQVCWWSHLYPFFGTEKPMKNHYCVNQTCQRHKKRMGNPRNQPPSSTEGFGSALDCFFFCCDPAPKQYDITLAYITLHCQLKWELSRTRKNMKRTSHWHGKPFSRCSARTNYCSWPYTYYQVYPHLTKNWHKIVLN
jgi:hypothetical protein